MLLLKRGPMRQVGKIMTTCSGGKFPGRGVLVQTGGGCMAELGESRVAGNKSSRTKTTTELHNKGITERTSTQLQIL